MSDFPTPRSDLLFDCIYDLDRSEAEWIEAIIQALGPLMDGGHGVVAHIVDPRDGENPMLGQYHADDALGTLEQYISTMLEEGIDPSNMMEIFGRPLEDPRGLESLAQSWGQSLGFRLFQRLFTGKGIVDALGIIVPHGRSMMFFTAHQNQLRPVPQRVRHHWINLQKHLVVLHELRLKIAEDTWDEETCLWFNAQGDFQSGNSVDASIRDRLRAAIRLRETALSRGKSADVASVEDFYTNVLNGQWVIVDHFDSDGKRHVVAVPVLQDTEGLRGLTPRERQVLKLLDHGVSNKSIGYQLGISTGAAAAHLHHIYRKLGVKDRASAVDRARFLNQIAPE